ncbi:alpha-L-fucosidase [Halioglobus sp. HI00S01]|uniref:alpha-L-fucosidase n=1 Tax=Halioglobus sp. HI00S01 TaxID=1822214 RepID=UPI0009EF64B4|nr:alpha-L-fucosidase [Halioglobus sp. HI00S01]
MSQTAFDLEIFGKRILVSLLLLGYCVAGFTAEPVFQGPYAGETEQQRDARMAWWREARFGLFIHWGVYAVPAGNHKGQQIDNIGEWIMHYGQIPVAEYQQYAKGFKPVNYAPDAWVRMAKNAGMKYIVITAKHHDGFALFDTTASDWNIVKATPYGKDVLKPLAEAAQRHGIKLGFYYSQAQDWVHPGGSTWEGRWDPAQEGSMDDYLRDIAVPQVRELLTNYGEVSILWWDTPIDMTPERASMFDGLVDLQPGIIVNDRLLYGVDGDLRTPEQHIPATGLDFDWEACQTMNTTWGYKSYDDDWKSSEQLIRNLIDVASKGGNYLLNVGPMATGEIPQPSIERLSDVGEWMSINGASIHGTTASPFVRLKWGRATKKEFSNATVLYLHVFDWPGDGILRVDGLHSEVTGAYFMADFQQQIPVEKTATGTVLQLPEKPLDKTATVIVLKVKGTLEVERILPKQDSDGALVLTLDDVNIHNPGYGGRLELRQEDDSPAYLDGWTDYRSQIDWLVQIDKGGTFELYAEVSAKNSAGFLMIVDDTEAPFSLTPTDNEARFQQQSLGRVTLMPGESKIQVHPQELLWNPIQLRSITLIPVSEE